MTSNPTLKNPLDCFAPMGLCPCGGEFFVSSNPPATAHSMPYCDAFAKLSPTEFLRWVSAQRKGGRP